MFYDFNIPYPAQPEPGDLDRIKRILKRITSIQHATVALNVSMEEALTEKTTQSIKPFPSDIFQNKLKPLKRVTVTVNEPKINYHLVSSNTANQHIDILACRPTNMDVCKHACQTYDVDIISIDCTLRRTVPPHVTARQAIRRGIFFEIGYSQAFHNPDKQALFFSNAKRLVDVTRGNNIIFSSEAVYALDIRQLSDLRMFGLMLGMRQEQVDAAMGANYRRLLAKAETRKSTLLAAIKVDDGIVPKEEDEETEKKRKREEEEEEEESESSKKQQTNQSC